MGVNDDNLIHEKWLSRYNDLDDATRKKIDEQPVYLASGATTIIGVGYKVNKELIIDKSLLDFDDKDK